MRVIRISHRDVARFAGTARALSALTTLLRTSLRNSDAPVAREQIPGWIVERD